MYAVDYQASRKYFKHSSITLNYEGALTLHLNTYLTLNTLYVCFLKKT